MTLGPTLDNLIRKQKKITPPSKVKSTFSCWVWLKLFSQEWKCLISQLEIKYKHPEDLNFGLVDEVQSNCQMLLMIDYVGLGR